MTEANIHDMTIEELAEHVIKIARAEPTNEEAVAYATMYLVGRVHVREAFLDLAEDMDDHGTIFAGPDVQELVTMANRYVFAWADNDRIVLNLPNRDTKSLAQPEAVLVAAAIRSGLDGEFNRDMLLWLKRHNEQQSNRRLN